MDVDIPSVFQDIIDKCSVYVMSLGPPNSSAHIRATEASSLLRELQFLDRSIVENFKSVSARQDLRMAAMKQLMIEKAIREDPHSEFARIMAANPRLRQSVTACAYTDAEQHPDESKDVLLRLQSDTTNFYYKAHRLLDVLKQLPRLKGVECKPVRIVRNHLLEHAGQRASNRENWSFGLDSHAGPRVRPIVVGSEPPSHSDQGYFSNRDALISVLRTALDKATSEAPGREK